MVRVPACERRMVDVFLLHGQGDSGGDFTALPQAPTLA